MPARDANRGRGGGRAGPTTRPSAAGGRQATAGASASPVRGGSAGTAAARGGESGAGRAGRGAAAASGASTAARPGDVEAGRSSDSPSGATRPSERQRDLEPVREGRAAPGEPSVTTGRGTQPGTRVTGRVHPGASGLSTWLAGADNPFAMMRRVEEDLDRVFRALGVPRFGPAVVPARELEDLLARGASLNQAARWSPPIEVLEREGNLVVRADLPGVKREDVEVNVDDDVLTIRGERRQEHRETEGGYRRTERSYGTFFRQIPLPDGVDPDQVKAAYNDGVLEVVVPSPRGEQQRRKRIEIR
jgi:HSP20 family protein